MAINIHICCLSFTPIGWKHYKYINRNTTQCQYLHHSLDLCHQRNMLKNFADHYLQTAFFFIGFILTLWRSYDCIEKYFYQNLSTKISMESSYDTILPSLVLCPPKPKEYNERWSMTSNIQLLIKIFQWCSFLFSALNSIGIENVMEYKEGNWFGNSSLDGPSIFDIQFIWFY